VCALILCSSAHAFAGNEFLWSNVEGFQSADSCQVKTAKTLDLQVLPATTLFHSSGAKKFKSVEGSLVKAYERGSDRTIRGQLHKSVRFVGVPNQSDLRGNEFARRTDDGYIPASEIRTLENYEIMISKPVARPKRPSVDAIGSSNVKLIGSVWRAAMKDKEFVTYSCGANTYTVFDVFADNRGTQAVARVGVSIAQSTILTNIDVRLVGGPRPAVTPPPAVQPPAPVAPVVQTAPAAPVTPAAPAPAKPAPVVQPKPQAKAKPAAAPRPRVTQNYAGQTCSAGDTDALKCMICVIHWEARLNSYVGMVAVGRTVMQRVASGRYPRSVCRVAYQPGQFVALQSGRRITSDRSLASRLASAAAEAISKGGGGFLGFRTCPNVGVNIGGNCFRRNALLEDSWNVASLLEEAELPEQRVQVAELAPVGIRAL
jgi:hypothetical protein